jgi:hypothetical protein
MKIIKAVIEKIAILCLGGPYEGFLLFAARMFIFTRNWPVEDRFLNGESLNEIHPTVHALERCAHTHTHTHTHTYIHTYIHIFLSMI